MKNLLAKFLIFIKDIQLSKLGWGFLIIAVLANLVLWLIWFKIHFSLTVLLFSVCVVVLNIFLSFSLSRKDYLFGDFLLGTALLIQLLFLLLIKVSLLTNY